MARRQHLSLMVLLGFMAFLTLTYFTVGGSSAERYPVKTDVLRSAAEDKTDIAKEAQKGDFGLPSDILKGGAIAPKLENATIKAELGRSSWRLLHTMMARFPEKPTADDSLALKTYIQLFARLYPCGDCAAHFQKLLAKYPPQVSSRNAAAGWACFVHNEVNARLKKPLFDCNNIGDFYDCGCGDDDKKKKDKEGSGKGAGAGEGAALKTQERKEDGGGGSSVSVEKEGLTRGG